MSTDILAKQDQRLIDKKLSNSQDYILDDSGDFATVNGDDSIAQMFINRVLSTVESWLWDNEYGSLLRSLLKDKSGYSKDITDNLIENYVSSATQELIDQGLVERVGTVKILDRKFSSIIIEVEVVINSNSQKIQFTIQS